MSFVPEHVANRILEHSKRNNEIGGPSSLTDIDDNDSSQETSGRLAPVGLEAAVLLLDISGFSALAEELGKDGAAG
eukprot:scaffold225988_cov41-Prasinocladus_malaysianus.AAC.1